MMVTVVRRAIRTTQPQQMTVQQMIACKPMGRRQSRSLSLHVEDHYALLLAAGY